jgi:hypothetical protein
MSRRHDEQNLTTLSEIVLKREDFDPLLAGEDEEEGLRVRHARRAAPPPRRAAGPQRARSTPV